MAPYFAKEKHGSLQHTPLYRMSSLCFAYSDIVIVILLSSQMHAIAWNLYYCMDFGIIDNTLDCLYRVGTSGRSWTQWFIQFNHPLCTSPHDILISNPPTTRSATISIKQWGVTPNTYMLRFRFYCMNNNNVNPPTYPFLIRSNSWVGLVMESMFTHHQFQQDQKRIIKGC